MSLRFSSIPMIVGLSLFAGSCTSAADESPGTTVGDTTTSEPTSSSTSSSAQVSTSPAGVECPENSSEPGTVSGVFDFVNMRLAPTVKGDLLGELDAGSDLAYFPESYASESDDLSWIAVQYDEDSCGWVAAKYVKGSDGQLLSWIGPYEFVERALFGLEPQASTATYIQEGAEGPEVPFDKTQLDTVLGELRELGRANPNATVEPDLSVESEDTKDLPGCTMGDGLHCRALVLDESGEVIAVVALGVNGDGISDLRLVSGS